MKKLIYSIALGMMVISACGPSAEQKAADAKRVADSIANVAKMQADSLAAAAKMQADSVASIAKAAADSLAAKANADSIAAAAKKMIHKATAPKPTKASQVKAGQGKG